MSNRASARGGLVKPTRDTPATIVITEDKHSVHFHGADNVLRTAVRRVGCPFQFDRRTRRLSVPREFGEEVADSIEAGPPRGVIRDRGLW
jgi:hypothetical protein